MAEAAATFARAHEGLEEMGASIGDRELVALLERHGAEEGAVLARYEQFAAEARSPAVRYLVQMIMEDERRHHRVMADLANAVAWGGFADMNETEMVPDFGPTREDPAFVAATRELLAIENNDAKELTLLRRKFKDYADTTVWSLLVETMLLDTEKHQRILQFIATHTRHRASS